MLLLKKYKVGGFKTIEFSFLDVLGTKNLYPGPSEGICRAKSPLQASGKNSGLAQPALAVADPAGSRARQPCLHRPMLSNPLKTSIEPGVAVHAIILVPRMWGQEDHSFILSQNK